MVRPDGSDPRPSDEEHELERVIGVLLRVCVLATSGIVLVGAALYVPGALHQRVAYARFIGEPQAYHSVAGILRAAVTGDGRAIIESGLLLLVLTPILRVVLSVFAFLRGRDHLYVAITLVVLGLLLYSLLAG